MDNSTNASSLYKNIERHHEKTQKPRNSANKIWDTGLQPGKSFENTCSLINLTRYSDAIVNFSAGKFLLFYFFQRLHIIMWLKLQITVMLYSLPCSWW